MYTYFVDNFPHNMNRDQLTQLGFSTKESATYLALLELGNATVSQLARRSGLNRTTLYDILPPLISRGLVTKVGGIAKETYAAQPPEKLISMLEEQSFRVKEQISLVNSLLPQLRLIGASSAKPQIELFEGHDGIVDLYESTLFASEEIRSFSSAESLESFDPTYLHGYYQRRAEKKIFIKAILNESLPARQYKKIDPDLYREVRIVAKNEMDISPEVYIYDNQVLFFSLKEGYAIRITSLDIATALKKLYDLAWKQAGRETSK